MAKITDVPGNVDTVQKVEVLRERISAVQSRLHRLVPYSSRALQNKVNSLYMRLHKLDNCIPLETYVALLDLRAQRRAQKQEHRTLEVDEYLYRPIEYLPLSARRRECSEIETEIRSILSDCILDELKKFAPKVEQTLNSVMVSLAKAYDPIYSGKEFCCRYVDTQPEDFLGGFTVVESFSDRDHEQARHDTAQQLASHGYCTGWYGDEKRLLAMSFNVGGAKFNIHFLRNGGGYQNSYDYLGLSTPINNQQQVPAPVVNFFAQRTTDRYGRIPQWVEARVRMFGGADALQFLHRTCRLFDHFGTRKTVSGDVLFMDPYGRPNTDEADRIAAILGCRYSIISPGYWCPPVPGEKLPAGTTRYEFYLQQK